MDQTYESTSQQRLIVVANRLPVSAVRERDGSWSLQVGQPNCLSIQMPTAKEHEDAMHGLSKLCKVVREVQAWRELSTMP